MNSSSHSAAHGHTTGEARGVSSTITRERAPLYTMSVEPAVAREVKLMKSFKFSDEQIDIFMQLTDSKFDHRLSFRPGVVNTRGKIRRLAIANNSVTKLFMKKLARYLNRTTVFPNCVHGSLPRRSPKTCAMAHSDIVRDGGEVLRLDVESCFDRLGEMTLEVSPACFSRLALSRLTKKVAGLQKCPSMFVANRTDDGVVELQLAHPDSLPGPFASNRSRAGVWKAVLETLLRGICQQVGGYTITGLAIAPWLLNVRMVAIDLYLEQLCQRSGHLYTRYVDDINISGRSPRSMLGDVRNAIRKAGFSLNLKKTRRYRKGRGRIVTGICLESGEPTISRKKRRVLRAMLHQAKKNGDTQLAMRALGHASWVRTAKDTGTHGAMYEQAKKLVKDLGVVS